MSIIEKAVNKLGKKVEDYPAHQPCVLNSTVKVPVALDPEVSAPALDRTIEEGEERGLAAPAPRSKVCESQSPSDYREQSTSDHEPCTAQQGESTKSRHQSSESEGKDHHYHKIPFLKLGELGMITPEKPRSRIAEEYRTIKRPLLMNIDKKGAAQVDNANLIMVTSALPGEGKTFSAVNLALSIAMEQDKTVLLVDADVTKASAANLLGIADDLPGLTNLLEGKEKDLGQVLIQTNVTNLRVLPAGHLHEKATELLASKSMARLMLELSKRYHDRVIIFDSPPLLLTTEAGVLANHMGQIMFVVAAEQTAQAAILEAMQYLDRDKIIGLVLNKAKQNRMDKHGYGYGYGYGYGHGNRSSQHQQMEPIR